MILELIGAAIWFILPAYFANSAPIIASKLKFIQKYNKPLDFGKTLRGKPILGSGKTWIGLIFGILIGTLVGFLQGVILLGFMLALGALIGDSAGSFIKRRLNIERGKKAPLLDQLDFIIGAFLFASFLGIFNWKYFIIILIITPIIHLLTNIIAYKFQLKPEPY